MANYHPINVLFHRIMLKVDKPWWENGCWLFAGHLNDQGYGLIALTNFPTPQGRVHRIVYQHYNPDYDPGLHVLHKCNTRNCVNPKHLKAGTHQENMDHAGACGRMNRPQNRSLSPPQVREIRELFKTRKSIRSIARKFGTSSRVLDLIREGKTYRDVV